MNVPVRGSQGAREHECFRMGHILILVGSGVDEGVGRE